MGQFGERLRREREMRGITLEEIAEATKIGSRSLRALETEDFAKLPGGIFNKGFVRSYARYLGIDAEQAVTDFLAAEAAYQQSTSNPVPSAETAAPSLDPSRFILAGAALVALALLFGGWKYYANRSARAEARETSQPAARARVDTAPARVDNGQTTQGVAQSQVAPATQPASSGSTASPAKGASSSGTGSGTTQSSSLPPVAAPQSAAAASGATVPEITPNGAGAAAEADSFVVRVRARKPSWITMNADGKPVMNAMLQPDAERSVRAQKRLVLMLGNAGGVEVFYNGTPLAITAQEHQTKTLVFTPQGLAR